MPQLARELRAGDIDADRFWAKTIPEPMSGCLLWMAAGSHDGYGHFGVRKAIHNAHRVAWTLARGPIPAGLQVLHRCDVRACVNPAHLFLGTNSDNMRDRLKKGRYTAGERHPGARLTTSDVAAIRASADTRRALAAKYGVTHQTISNIVHGRKWAHVR